MVRVNGGGACPGMGVTACCTAPDTPYLFVLEVTGLLRTRGLRTFAELLTATFVTRAITRG